MSIQSVLLSYDGRINRSDFWLKGILPLVVISFIAGIAVVVSALITPVLSVVVYLVFIPLDIWIYYAIVAKRFHDRGKSGWWGLVNFIPLIGPLWIIVECGFMEGTDGDNAFGPKP